MPTLQHWGGFAVGKLLRELFNDWKERYDARGAQNDRILDPNTPPEVRNKLLEEIGLSNPGRAERLRGQLAERGIIDGDTPQANLSPPISSTPAPQSQILQLPQSPQQSGTSGINPNARAVQQATAKLLGDTDFLARRGMAEDEPWRDEANWNQYKWNNADDVLKSLQMGWQRNGLRF